MMDTDGLIRRLARKIEPVTPLPNPWMRAAIWFAVSAPYVAFIVLLMNPRHDLGAKVFDSRYVVEQTSALAAGLTAAAAAFASTVPGYNRKLLMLPLAPLALWLGTLGAGCFQDWIHHGPDGLAIRPDWMCLPVIGLMGTIPGAAMSLMLRRGAPLTPHLTSALGGLAAAGLGSFGLRLTESQDAGVMVLVWQVGSVMVLSAAAASAGRRLLNWNAITGSPEDIAR